MFTILLLYICSINFIIMRKLIHLSLFFMFMFCNHLYAQKSKIALEKIKRGIHYTQKDSLFSLGFEFRMQNRVQYMSKSLSDFTPESFEMRVRRLRLKFKGFVYDPRLTYYIQLCFSKGDLDWDSETSNAVNSTPNIVRDAVIYYEVVKGLKFGIGQTKLPGNRQRVTSSGDQQFFDRSIVNSTFTLDRDFGLFATYSHNYFRIKGAVTSGEGRNVIKSDKGLNYTGRIEVLPFGKFTGDNESWEGDLAREEKPKMNIAAGYNYNVHAMRTGGTLGNALHQYSNMQNFHADISFKYKGFALLNEYCQRWVDVPVTINSDNEIAYVYNGFGNNTQLSYCFKNKYEIAARYSFVSPNKNIYDNPDFTSVNAKRLEQWQLGVTKYLIDHRMKLQFDILYHLAKDLRNASQKGQFGAVFQIELGI